MLEDSAADEEEATLDVDEPVTTELETYNDDACVLALVDPAGELVEPAALVDAALDPGWDRLCEDAPIPEDDDDEDDDDDVLLLHAASRSVSSAPALRKPPINETAWTQ